MQRLQNETPVLRQTWIAVAAYPLVAGKVREPNPITTVVSPNRQTGRQLTRPTPEQRDS
jgi:hypothetical protein